MELYWCKIKDSYRLIFPIFEDELYIKYFNASKIDKFNITLIRQALRLLKLMTYEERYVWIKNNCPEMVKEFRTSKRYEVTITKKYPLTEL